MTTTTSASHLRQPSNYWRCVILSYVMLSYVVSSYIMSCHLILSFVMLCHVMSSHVMSCHLMSCHLMSCHLMSCHVISSHVMSSHVMLYYVMSSWSAFTHSIIKFILPFFPIHYSNPLFFMLRYAMQYRDLIDHLGSTVMVMVITCQDIQ